ncbi:hypothetical protein BC2926_01840 [Bacillus cereus]|nr:hypothetical protein BC2926_01840 [Bacillus cereus]
MTESMPKGLEGRAMDLQKKLIPELIEFCKPYFISEEEAKEFVLTCEKHENPLFKRALHQLQRHINLSNDMEKIQKEKDTFQVFFWIVAIEAIFKASTKHSKKQKAEIIREFFKNYISQEDQCLLMSRVKKNNNSVEHTTIEIVADMLNVVRNLFAHEGIYWMFSFPQNEGEQTLNILPKEKTTFLSTYTMGTENMDTYLVFITKQEVQNIIVKGAINFIKDNLQKHNE